MIFDHQMRLKSSKQEIKINYDVSKRVAHNLFYICLMKRVRLLILFCGVTIGLNTAGDGLAKLQHKANRPGVYWHGNTSENKVALTFDDGPAQPYTEQILDVLKKYDVRATFFLIGQNVERYPAITKRIIAEGHTVGNHTYNHSDLVLSNKGHICYQIGKAENVIVKETKIKPSFFRPPYGYNNARVSREAGKAGYIVVLWSVSGKNGIREPKADKIAQKVISSAQGGSIILLHDGNRLKKKINRKEIVKALPLIIEGLQKQGYQIVSLSELLGVDSEKI